MAAQVASFFHAPTNTWSHIVSDTATCIAAVIDPVLDFEPASCRVSNEHAQVLLTHVREHGLRVEWILETHAHADHLSAADWLKRALPHAQTGIGAGIVAVQKHFAKVFAFGAEFRADGAQFDHLFIADEVFRLGELEARVIATPGHTSDGVSYWIDDAVFVGDTLFSPDGGTGRCDFPGADAATQYRSIQRLYALPDATRVFLCHDYPESRAPTAQTTIGAEKAGNLQLNAATREADYIALRQRRDATLSAPRLLYPSLQVNICAGQLPPSDVTGRLQLRSPATTPG